MIVIDTREDREHPEFAKWFRRIDVHVEIVLLPVGDFYIHGEEKRVLVERSGVRAQLRGREWG